MNNNKSCVGCKYLFADGSGYSNYTWMETFITCAKDKNPKLSASEPSDWNKENDNFPATMNGRCKLYSEGVFITLDPDRDSVQSDFDADDEVWSILHKDYGAKL